MTYTPRSDTVAAKVLGFFAANPDEELTNDDVAAKFGVSTASVPTLLAPALKAGLLGRSDPRSGGAGKHAMWRKGEGGKTFDGASELPPFPVAVVAKPEPLAALSAQLRARLERQEPDFSAVADLTPNRPEPAKKAVRAAVWSSGELAIETADETFVFDKDVAREVIAFLKRVEVPA